MYNFRWLKLTFGPVVFMACPEWKRWHVVCDE